MKGYVIMAKTNVRNYDVTNKVEFIKEYYQGW
jgi:hypothetical protein